MSPFDYKHFGDAITFDVTYKANTYRMLLVLIVGVNHHRRTCILVMALIVDETIEMYT